MRAELLDEGLELLTRLWAGMPVRFEGKHYQVDVNEENFLTPPPPPPVQQPRIPIWVVGAWLKQKSMQRALRYDGLLPNVMGADGKVRMSPATPQEVSEMRAYVQAQRTETTPFDIVVEGETPGEDPAAAAVHRATVCRGGGDMVAGGGTAPGGGRRIWRRCCERIRQGPPEVRRRMDVDKKITIIGGGLAGLTAGTLLAKKGLQVQLLEAREKTGGCCATTDVQGFTFNDGALCLILPEVLDHAFSRLGLERDACLPLRKINSQPYDDSAGRGNRDDGRGA